MPHASLVLVDTSVWIRYFRLAHSAEGRALDMLLSSGPVATCDPIRAEVLSGAPTRRDFERLQTLFDALVCLEPAADVWHRIAEHRFTLARRGHQASLIDLFIALIATTHHAALWTLDDDFDAIATTIPMTRYQPHSVA